METIWLVVLWLAILLFGGMLVVCGVGGIRDILSLFRFLQEEHKQGPGTTIE
jgi:hypothetical protein